MPGPAGLQKTSELVERAVVGESGPPVRGGEGRGGDCLEEQETAREGEKAGSVRWRGAEVAGVCGLLLVLLGVLALVAVDQPGLVEAEGEACAELGHAVVPLEQLRCDGRGAGVAARRSSVLAADVGEGRRGLDAGVYSCGAGEGVRAESQLSSSAVVPWSCSLEGVVALSVPRSAASGAGRASAGAEASLAASRGVRAAA